MGTNERGLQQVGHKITVCGWLKAQDLLPEKGSWKIRLSGTNSSKCDGAHENKNCLHVETISHSILQPYLKL